MRLMQIKFFAALLLAPVSAWAHALRTDDLWQTWTFTPAITVPLLLTAAVYARGWRRRRHQGHPLHPAQIIAFYSGMLCFFIALQSPIEPLSDHFFFIHQVEHLLLRVFGPLLTILAMPLAPLIQGLPSWARHRLLVPVIRNRGVKGVYRCLSHPLVAPVLFIAVLAFWQVPTIHDRAVQEPLLHDLMHLSMIVTGFFFWWLIADPRRHRAALPFGLRLIVLWAVTIPNTLLGAGITLSRHPLYQVYDVLAGRWGLDRLTDQQIGGILIWGPGAMMGVIGTGVVFLLWIRAERKPPPKPHLSAVT